MCALISGRVLFYRLWCWRLCKVSS